MEKFFKQIRNMILIQMFWAFPKNKKSILQGIHNGYLNSNDQLQFQKAFS